MLAPLSEQQLNTERAGAIIDSRQRVLLMAVRQALIMVLGALEDYLQLERSIVPKHRR